MAADPVDPALSHGWRHAVAPAVLVRAVSSPVRVHVAVAAAATRGTVRRRRRRAIRRGQCGTGDLAFSCTGECGLCIFFPGNEDPNCCCDDTCTEFGDCCDDFDACCPANGAKFAFLQKLETREKVARARGDTAVQTSADDEGREARRRRPARVRVVDVSARRAKGGSARVAARSARILDLD